jgi:hypothetical protein
MNAGTLTTNPSGPVSGGFFAGEPDDFEIVLRIRSDHLSGGGLRLSVPENQPLHAL